MKIVQILIKSTSVNSEVLVDLKNIESPAYLKSFESYNKYIYTLP
jgi:hypothetical protein